ncbi:MAG: hypothetical protein ABSA13_09105 [Beijerinckiaceae bacterium]|jgi:hypothetical protein
MRNLILALATGAALSVSAAGVNAAPMTAVYDAGQAPEVILVSGGCGPDGHRNGWGRCVPNFRPVVVCAIRPTPYGPRRICR